MRFVPVAVLVALILACGGGAVDAPVADVVPSEPVPTAPDPVPAAAPAPSGESGADDTAKIEAAAAELALVELLPSDTADPSKIDPALKTARSEAIAAFLAEHPELFEGDELFELKSVLWHYEANTVEEAHAYLVSERQAKPPLEVTLPDAGWKTCIVVSQSFGYSDDWAWFVEEVSGGLEAKGVECVHAGFGIEAVNLKLGAEDTMLVGLAPWLHQRGYVFVKEGAEPTWVDHDMSQGVLDEANRYFGF